jgi:hypothetical protein
VSFAAITLCVASYPVLVVVSVYFGIDLVRKFLDTPSYTSMGVHPEVSGLATWSENCKEYKSVPLGAVVSLFCESV